MEQITPLLKKYNHFKDAQIRSAQQFEDGRKAIQIIVQDDDGQDVAGVEFTFDKIKEFRLLQNNVLAFLDMMSGVSIIKENNFYGFALGSGTAMLHVLNAPMYVVASELSVKELDEF